MTRRTSTAVLLAALTTLVAVAPARAQTSESELVTRINRLEAQVRQLTGTIEQLQFRNQQLEQQLAARPSAPPARTAVAMPPAPQPPPLLQAAPLQAPLPAQAGPQRRTDVFDPNDNPGAPGAPRTLGSVPPSPPPPGTIMDEEPQGRVPRGREAGAPLDLSTLSTQAVEDPSLAPPGPVAARPGEIRTIPGVLPPPPPRNPSATGPQMVMAPSQTPKDEYDLAYGYMLRKDYALAEDALRAFLRKYPSDHQVADANYWLGESLFQRQRYRDAAEVFLSVSTKFGSSAKAPDALLRLAQSLAALKEKETACATLGEIPRKYPRASASIKSAAEREQKRVGC